MSKEQLKQHLRKNGKDRTYSELAQMYNITNNAGYISDEAVRSIWRNLKKKEKLEKNEDNIDTEGMTIKRVWKRAEGGYSVEYSNNVSFDPQEFREKLVEEISKFSPKQYKLDYKKSSKDSNLLEISIPDIHYGKEDLKETENKFIEAIKDILSKAGGYNIEKIVLPIGNDGMHSEGKRRTTTKGTPQQDQAEWFETFKGYWQMLVEGIDMIKQVAPVDVISVLGNHDLERCQYLSDVLFAWYRNDENVTVNNDMEYRKYYQYGKCMILYTHGDDEGPKDLVMNMPMEQPQMFSECKHCEVHVGHIHKETVLDEFKKIKVRFLPSLCSTDEWHKKKGFEQYKAAQGLIWNKNRGLEGFVQSNLE